MEKVYLHKLDGNLCGECLIKKKYVPYAMRFSNLKTGNCQSVGYTVKDGHLNIKVPIIGNLFINKYKLA
jgi:hypothetical protein